MIRLIVNVAMIIVVTGLVAISIVILIKFLNFVVQFVAEQFGYEVGDFFEWVMIHLPRKSK